MSRRRLRSLQSLSRGAYRRLRSREEGSIATSLRHDAGAPELVLSPHWDDAVLSCWGVLASERDVTVVNLFAGVPPAGERGTWEAVLRVEDSAQRARERIAEDARALALAGRKPVNLPLLDAQFRRRLGAALEPRDLDGALAAEVRSASRVYVPAGIGGHADHVLARRYGRALARARMPVSLYADLPYCTFHGWPSWVDGREPAPTRDVDAYWRSFLKGVAEMPPLHAGEVERLDAGASAAKREALRCYEASLNYGVRQLLSDPAFHGFEVRWQLAIEGGARARPGGSSEPGR
jgi:LmbE family N-acetylglucosaminyl deacetylase